MTAGRHDWRIDQGADLEEVWEYLEPDEVTPINLTGYTARLQVRKPKGSATKLLDLSTGHGITLGGALGTITITRTAAQTSALDWEGNASWDLEVIPPGGKVKRLLEGFVVLSKEVTR